MEWNFDEIFELDRNKEELSVNEIDYLNTLSIKEIEKIQDELLSKANFFNSKQMGLKLILNGIYGAFGNAFFVCSDVSIAESITIMGQELIKFVDDVGEQYFYDIWHIDYDLHEQLGISNIKPINPGYIDYQSETDVDVSTKTKDEIQHEIELGKIRRKVPVAVYTDTDSCFFSFDPVFNSFDFNSYDGDEMDFILKVSKLRLEPLFDKKLTKLAKKYGVKNEQVFELENICESIIHIVKKYYIKHILWEDGRVYNRLEKIKPKGVKLIKGGTPKFAREKVLEIIKYIFDNYKTYNIKDLMKFVKGIRKEYELVPINDIAQSTSLTYYYSHKEMIEGQMADSKGIVEDKTDLIWGANTYFTTKASGLHNYLLNKHPELENHYEKIKPGDKIRYYPCKHEKNDKFAYHFAKYPQEFAPQVDYDLQFYNTVSKQINDYMVPLKMPELNSRLSIVMSLF
jgi:DNA polymerase elongation subunit (family B)